jgi:hypothetical protein
MAGAGDVSDNNIKQEVVVVENTDKKNPWVSKC